MSNSVVEKTYLGIRISDGVTGWHMTTFYLTCVATILLGTFVNAFQPFLFNEMMQIPTAEQGMISGKLNFWGEMAIISSVGVWGALSDKLGRRLIIVLGFLLVAVAMYLYPYAQSVNELILYRVIYGLGIASATCMIVTLLADYAKDMNRGKAAGLQGVCNGIGAVIALFVLLRLPAMFQQQGLTAFEAGTQTYLIVAAVAVVVGLLSARGLKAHQREAHAHKQSIVSLMVDGIKAAREPGIALAYGAAFVSRANLTIVGAFMTLWLSHYGTEQAGMSAADALKKAGIIVAIAQSVALFGAPLFGILTDRLNRVTALLIALFITFVGYCSTYLISDPFGGGMIVVVVIIGLSEIGAIITSGVLISQQTPANKRGAVIGIFNLCGAVGILVSSVAGGYLYDHWDQSGPFVFVGCCGLIVFIWGLLVRNKVVPLN